MWNPRTRILLTRNFVGPQWVLLSSKLLSFTFEQCTFLWCCSLCRKRWPRRLNQIVESFSVTIQMKATALYFPVMVELNLVTLSFKPAWKIMKCEDSNESDWMLLTVFCVHQPFLPCALMQSFFLSTSWKFAMSTCCPVVKKITVKNNRTVNYPSRALLSDACPLCRWSFHMQTFLSPVHMIQDGSM